MIRIVTLLALLVAFAAAGCGSAATKPPATTFAPRPTIDRQAAAHELASRSLSDLLRGAETTPTLVDWPIIESLAPPPQRQSNALCKALDAPFADKVIAGLVSVGFNALSLKLGHKPIGEEARTIIDLTTTFAIKTCPSWMPGLTAAATPVATPWYPAGYRLLWGDPNVAWSWGDPPTCASPGVCWNVDVVARSGCQTSLSIALAAYDDYGVVVDVGGADLGPALAGVPQRIEVTSDAPTAKSATVDFLSCT